MKNEKIINLNPLLILSRGYSITYKDDKILKSKNDLQIGDEVTTNLSDGIFKSIIKEIK